MLEFFSLHNQTGATVTGALFINKKKVSKDRIGRSNLFVYLQPYEREKKTDERNVYRAQCMQNDADRWIWSVKKGKLANEMRWTEFHTGSGNEKQIRFKHFNRKHIWPLFSPSNHNEKILRENVQHWIASFYAFL